MLGCLCPQCQGRATINAETPTLYFLTFTELSGDGGLYCTCTDRHTQRHRHMLERVCLLRGIAETKDKKKKNQRYDNLATKPRRQCSTLWAALRVLWFTDHVDIPPIALEHTHSYMQPGTNARPSTQKRPPDVCARAMRSESLFSLLPLQKPESLWRTFSFTLAETFAMEKNLSNNCYRKIKT